MTTTTRALWYEPGSPEWEAVWSELRGRYLAPAFRGDERPCPACCEGECWQYHGTYPDLVPGMVVSQFRHRNYPGRGRLYVNVGMRAQGPAFVWELRQGGGLGWAAPRRGGA